MVGGGGLCGVLINGRWKREEIQIGWTNDVDEPGMKLLSAG